MSLVSPSTTVPPQRNLPPPLLFRHSVLILRHPRVAGVRDRAQRCRANPAEARALSWKSFAITRGHLKTSRRSRDISWSFPQLRWMDLNLYSLCASIDPSHMHTCKHSHTQTRACIHSNSHSHTFTHSFCMYSIYIWT